MVKKLKFVFLDQDDIILSPEYLKPLKERGTVEIYNTLPENEEILVERAGEADVLFFATANFGPATLDRLPRLKVLQFLGTGVWNLVDMEYAHKKGIKVLNIENYGNNAVAEFTLALAFCLARNIPAGMRKMDKRVWSVTGLEGVEIEGSTFGVVGTGNIGAVVAAKASLLGARVLAYDIFEKEYLKKDYGVIYTGLDKVLKEADFLTLHLKTTPETTGLIDARFIASMKKEAFFINAARAEIVDNDALYEALRTKKLRGAALDVFTEEPPRDYRFSRLENVITTPHIGFYTRRAALKMLNMSIENALKALDQK